MHGWILHDSYKTAQTAIAAGKNIIDLGLAKAVKINQPIKKNGPCKLYILPLKSREVK